MRVLLIDDHPSFRDGLIYLLPALGQDLEFLEAGSCEEAIGKAGDPDINLILLDLHMPGVNGLNALSAVRAAFDVATVVVLSSEDDPVVIRAAIESGASGYIPKSSTSQVMIAALRLILAGGIYLPPHVLLDSGYSAPVEASPAAEKTPRAICGLSGRQLEVLLKAVQGKANKVIAREMNLSEGTVKAHLSASFRSLGVQNRTEAVFAAAKLGITPQDVTTL